jgi:hypothetical protein
VQLTVFSHMYEYAAKPIKEHHPVKNEGEILGSLSLLADFHPAAMHELHIL